MERIYAYDAISLGEIMLRLDPGEGRIRTARTFNVWEGGGEYNVIRGLHKCFGMNTAVITAVADNEIGKLLIDLIEQGGVDTRLVLMKETDGIGRRCRNGINFVERGYGVRGAIGCSDRANTAISQLSSKDIDFEYIFGELGVKWFHTGGIYAALSENSAATILDAIKCAKKYGTIVSYDLNYRPSLWNGTGGIVEAQAINKKIVEYVDVLFGNEEDFTACLGIDAGNRGDYTSLNGDSYENMLFLVAEKYPNIKYIATTLREVKSASINNWSAICYNEGRVYKSKRYDNLEILDRVGGGDSFAAGFIYGLMKEKGVQNAVEYGAAHGALAMTTPGDTSMASIEEVEALIFNASARVKR